MIDRLSLRNWLCFRGGHDLDLEASIYGVVAKYADDSERSNWAGKTSVIESIPFALYGWHRFRTEDEWITNGEDDGGVVLKLDDGTTIDRSRERGKSTRLEVTPGRGGEKFAVQEEAQAIIEERIGLSREDFFATAYLEQRNAARFVLARPAERAAVIGGWLGLGPLQRAHARVAKRLATAIDEVASFAGGAGLLADELVRIGEATGAEASDEGGFETVVEAAERAMLAARVKREAAEQIERAYAEAVEDAKDAARLVVDAERHGTLVSQEAALRARLGPKAPRLEPLRKALGAAIGASGTASEGKGRLSVVAGKDFAGDCPAAPGFRCPVPNEVIACARERSTAVQEARDAATEAERVVAKAREALAGAEAKARARERIDAEILATQREIARLAPAAEQVAAMEDRSSMGDVRREHDDARATTSHAVGELRLAEERFERARKVAGQLVQLQGDRAKAEKRVRLCREASEILGRRGAQRVISEEALAEVEESANGLLTECEIDLSVRLSWEREGKALADSCEECGAAYPKGRAVKECAKCGANRGAKLDERLEVVLSDRSGAAEDLAGVAIQLAAARWLRARRGASWDVALLDEVFGQLDPSHRKTLAAHVAARLRDDGMRQALIVAHDTATLGAMPARIQVTAGPKGSRVEVTA